MSGDWIKFERATFEKPEVYRMSTALGIERDAVIGKLLRVWAYFDAHSCNAMLRAVDFSFIDALVCAQNFAQAMEDVGWLKKTENGIVLPNYNRHSSKSAKKRALSALRMQRHRKRHGERNASVTSASPEKRREEKNNNTPLTPQGGEGKCASHPRRKRAPTKEEAIQATIERVKKKFPEHADGKDDGKKPRA